MIKQLSIFDLLISEKSIKSLQVIDKKEVSVFKNFKKTQKDSSIEITICKVKSGYFYILHLNFKTFGLAFGIGEEENVFIDFYDCLSDSVDYLKQFLKEKKESKFAIDWLKNLMNEGEGK